MDNPLVIYSTVLILGQTGMQHNRAKYGALDLLGDLGGVLEVIMILFGFALYKEFKKEESIKTEQKV